MTQNCWNETLETRQESRDDLQTFILTAQIQVVNIAHHIDHTFKFKVIILANFIALYKKYFTFSLKHIPLSVCSVSQTYITDSHYTLITSLYWLPCQHHYEDMYAKWAINGLKCGFLYIFYCNLFKFNFYIIFYICSNFYSYELFYIFLMYVILQNVLVGTDNCFNWSNLHLLFSCWRTLFEGSSYFNKWHLYNWNW